MKTIKKKVFWFTVIALTGIILLATNILKGNNDASITGFASGLIVISFIKTIQFIRISKDSALLKKFEITQNEERFIMLSEKSGRFTFLLTVISELISGIILMFIGMNDIATIVCFVAAIQTLIYILIYYWLSKRF